MKYISVSGSAFALLVTTVAAGSAAQGSAPEEASIGEKAPVSEEAYSLNSKESGAQQISSENAAACITKLGRPGIFIYGVACVTASEIASRVDHYCADTGFSEYTATLSDSTGDCGPSGSGYFDTAAYVCYNK